MGSSGLKNIACTILFAFSSITGAYAQNIKGKEPLPLLGSKTLARQRIYTPKPALTAAMGGRAGIGYHDNINRLSSNPKGDALGIINPKFKLNSVMKPCIAELESVIELGRYLTRQENNYNDADIKGNIGYRLNPYSYLYADGRFRYDHIDIGAFADEPERQAAEPTTYRYIRTAIGWALDGELWIGKLEAQRLNYNYDNILREDGTRFINDDRDYISDELTAKAGYKFWQETALYVQGKINQRDYLRNVDTTFLEPHDSTGYEILAGAMYGSVYHKASQWFADISIGYLQQDFSHSTLPDVNIPAMRVLLQWHPTERFRMQAKITREVREAILAATSSYIQSRAGLRAEYQFMPYWLAGGSLHYSEHDFQINPLASLPRRVDYIRDGSLFLEYELTPEYGIGAEIKHLQRDSIQPRVEYQANNIMLYLKADY